MIRDRTPMTCRTCGERPGAAESPRPGVKPGALSSRVLRSGSWRREVLVGTDESHAYSGHRVPELDVIDVLEAIDIVHGERVPLAAAIELLAVGMNQRTAWLFGSDTCPSLFLVL